MLPAAVAAAAFVLADVGVAAASATGEIGLASATAAGVPAAGGLLGDGNKPIAISADGRVVAFALTATNLDARDDDGLPDIYVKDLSSGIITLASTSPAGVKSNGESDSPTLSADGSFVAFTSTATNLDPAHPEANTGGGSTSFVKNLATGSVVIAATTSTGALADNGSLRPVLSADATKVAFLSDSTNLDPRDALPNRDVYVKDLSTGTVTLASVAADGTTGAPDSRSSDLDLSLFGDTVAFQTTAQLDPADVNGSRDIYVKDLETGELWWVSASGPDTGNGGGTSPSISGSHVAYESGGQIYVTNIRGGGTPRLASVSATGQRANLPARTPSLSTDHTVAFRTSASNLDPLDTDGSDDVYVKSLASGTLRLASASADGVKGDRDSSAPALARYDGAHVAFGSASTTLLPGTFPGSDPSVLDGVFVKLADASSPEIILDFLDPYLVTLHQVVVAHYRCVDPFGVAVCLGSVPDGATVDTSTPGRHLFSITATDIAGNTTTQDYGYFVLAGNVLDFLVEGRVVTTDPGGLGATPEIPVQTAVTPPAGVHGDLSITPQTPGPSPLGYTLFGKEIVIAGAAATATAPYVVSFTIDQSALGGLAPADIQVFRNSSVIGGCSHPSQAVPDPCIVSRGFALGGMGDAIVTVRTSQFSTWSFGRHDSDPPQTTITAGPPDLTSDSTPTFVFESSEAGSSFACRIDGGAVVACGSPLTTSVLAEGAHTFSVVASDAAGNADPTPATRSFTVDTIAPQTTITSGPGTATLNSTPTFTFSSSETGSLECRLDGGAWVACSSPTTTQQLSDGELGQHSFSVRATDRAGNTDLTPASQSFVVTAPTRLAAAPAQVRIENLVKLRVSPVATLTHARTGAPVVGRTIAFSIGNTPVCSATTDATGVARCSGLIPLLGTLLSLGYDARFAGEARFAAATAHGALVSIG